MPIRQLASVLVLTACVLSAATNAELVVQSGHASVKSVAYSPNGRLIVTAGAHTAILWDAATGAQLRTFSGHTDNVMSAVFSSSGSLILTASADGTARIWEAATGKELRRITPPRAEIAVNGQPRPSFPGVQSAAFSADDKHIFTGGVDGRAREWNATSGALEREFSTVRGNSFAITETCVAPSPDGRLLLTGVLNGSSSGAELWDLDSGRRIQTLEGRTYPRDLRFYDLRDLAGPVAFSPDGKLLLADGPDTSLRIWDAATRAELRRIPVAAGGCSSVAFSPDGKRIATAGAGSVQIWDVDTAKPLAKLPQRGTFIRGPDGGIAGALSVGTSQPSSVAFSPNNATLLVGQYTGSAVWDTAKMVPLVQLEHRATNLSSLSISAGGRLIVANGPQIWDLNTGAVSNEANEQRLPAAVSPDLSDDARRVAVAVGPAIALFDSSPAIQPPTFEEAKTTEKGPPGTVDVPHDISRIAYSPNGRKILATFDSLGGDGSILLWDGASGRITAKLDQAGVDVETPFAVAAFSPDGNDVLSAGSDRVIRLWDAATGKEIRKFEPYDYTPRQDWVKVWSHWDLEARTKTSAIAFSPDGKQIYSAGLGGVRIWNKGTGKEIGKIEGSLVGIDALAVSPDGRVLVAGCDDGKLRAWETASGRKIFESAAHAAVTALAYLPDGQTIVSAGDDGAIRLWSAPNGTPLATLIGFEDGGWTVADPQGRFDSNNLDANPGIRWVVSDDPFRALPVEVFTRQYYTPALLPRILRRESLPAVPNIGEINRVRPSVGKPLVTAAASGRVSVRVPVAREVENGRPSGAQDLRLFRDGQMVALQKGQLEDKEYVFDNIRLPHEKSVVFSAYAFNSDLVKSDTASAIFTPRETLPAVKPQTYLINVGVDRLQASGCPALNYAASDAVRMGDALQPRFPSVTRRVLATGGDPGANPAKETIRSAFAAVARVATPDDTFIFSFAGHGYTDKSGRFFLFPADLQGSCANLGDPRLLASAISADELAAWLGPLDAGEIVLILDACYSAASVEAGDFRPGPLGSAGLGQLAYDKRIRVLAAAQSSETAQESSSLKMGFLTYALLTDGLEKKKADWQPVDGHILLREWLRYGQKRVPDLFTELQSSAAPARGVTATKRELIVQRPALFDFAPADRPGAEIEHGAAAPANVSVESNRAPAGLRLPVDDSAARPSAPRVPAPALPETTAILTIVSGFPSRPGAANPIGGIPLSLMREDFAATLNRAGIKVRPGALPRDVLSKECAKSNVDCGRVINASIANPAASAMMDNAGRGTFPGVAPGTYYLMIYAYDAKHQPIHWNLKVELRPGPNSVTLRPETAMYLH